MNVNGKRAIGASTPASIAVFAVLVASFVCPRLIAQQGKDVQSAVEPRTRPGAGQKFLEKFVGDWDVVKTFYSPSGQAARTEGTCRQTMIHAGRFLQSEFTFGKGEKQTTGLGIIGFEP